MTRWLVVGAGAAGCVVAARLSEDESNDVTLIEAGDDHGTSVAQRGEPVLTVPALVRPSTDVVRVSGGAQSRYVQGHGVGGSSLVNGGIVVGDVATWSSGHKLPIGSLRSVGAIGAAVLDATGDAAKVAAVGRDDRRVSVADAYLRPVTDRPNLSIVTGATVDRLKVERPAGGLPRVVGVVLVSGAEVEADRVVLCGGAIASPTILLRSGVDTPGVGLGLQDHAGVALSFDLADAAKPEVSAIGVTVERPGRQIVVLDRIPDRLDMGAVIAGHLAVGSVGRVSVPDPAGPPRVELRQLSASGDLDGLSLVAREALALLASPRVREAIGDSYADDHGTPTTRLLQQGVLRSWLPSALGGYHHLAGSCRLGVCLRSDGALIGYEGVYVTDASALPGVPQRNPYLRVIRLAERLAAGWVASGT